MKHKLWRAIESCHVWVFGVKRRQIKVLCANWLGLVSVLLAAASFADVQVSSRMVGDTELALPVAWVIKSERPNFVYAHPEGDRSGRSGLLVFMTEPGLIQAAYSRLEHSALALLDSESRLVASQQIDSGERWAEFTNETQSRHLTVHLQSREQADVMVVLAGPTQLYIDWGGRGLAARTVGTVKNSSDLKLTNPRGESYRSETSVSVVGNGGGIFVESSIRRGGTFKGSPGVASDLHGERSVVEFVGTTGIDTGLGSMIDMSASSLVFNFDPDGDYTLDWQFRVTTGFLMTDATVRETGRWHVDAGIATLKPDGYDGSMVIMSGQEHALSERGNPARQYRLIRTASQEILSGYCAPFQVELECEEDGIPSVLDFPLN
ncbi:MAG: hypothetical protein AAF541_06940 [Pseudomonadota bacterium]